MTVSWGKSVLVAQPGGSGVAGLMTGLACRSNLLVTCRYRMAAEAVARVVLRCEKAQEDEHLDLSSCLLEAVPQAVYHLLRNSTLKSCDLSHNALTVMSKKIAMKFPLLTSVNISDNKIEKFPDEINEMTVLETLNATNNQIAALTETFYQLPALQCLDLSHNQLTELDASKLCNMPAIKEINLEHNPICGEVYSDLKQLAQDKDIQIIISEPPATDHMD